MHKTNNVIMRVAIASSVIAGVVLTPLRAFGADQPSPYTMVTRYDLNHQVTGIIHPSADTTALYPAVRNTYDGKGLLVVVEEGVLTEWQSDTVAPANWPATVFNVARKTINTYNAIGQKVTEAGVDLDGKPVGLTQYNYDQYGRLNCKAVRMNPTAYNNLPDACKAGPEGPAGPDRITQYTYKVSNIVTTEKRAVDTPLAQTYMENRYDNINSYTTQSTVLMSDQLDANGNLTHYDYDALSRLKHVYFPSKTSGAATSSGTDYEEYGYDGNGNRTTIRKRDSKVITSNYDNLNRVWRRDVPNADDTIVSVFQGYDLLGNQLYARFGSESGAGITFAYNGFGEMVSETSNMSGTSNMLSYQYDLNGNRTLITYPDGSKFTYKYDQLDRLTDIYEGDNTGPALIHYSYDNLARPKSMTTAGAVNTTIYYDSASRPQIIALDPVGASYDVSHALAYNPAGQIASDTLSNNNFQYLEKRSSVGAYTANGLNEYTQVGSLVYGYDNNGNLKSDGSTNYTYDEDNRLISATGAKNATLKYDPLGHLYQITGATTTNFLYSGDSLIAEYRNGVMTKRYVFGVGVDKPLVMYDGATVTSDKRQFLHGNHQGSIIAITDSAGNVVAANTYDPFGVPSVYNQGRFAFTGQTYLDEVGMYYYKARIYYPQIGRFLQTDPVGYKDDMNLYAYVGNDPLNKTDPTGMVQFSGCREAGDSYICGGSLSSGQASSQTASDMAAGAKAGAALGAGAGVLISGGCDLATLGACAPANPEIVALGASGGALVGAAAGPPFMASSRLLAKNIAAATNAIKQKFEDSHHIVAENDSLAAGSRAILSAVGMDVNSAFNGMNMSRLYHSRLHTNLYHREVEKALTGATSYADVAARLSVIRIQIYMGTFPF